MLFTMEMIFSFREMIIQPPLRPPEPRSQIGIPGKELNCDLLFFKNENQTDSLFPLKNIQLF